MTALTATLATEPCPVAVLPGHDYKVTRAGELAGWVVMDDKPEAYGADGMFIGVAADLDAAVELIEGKP